MVLGATGTGSITEGRTRPVRGQRPSPAREGSGGGAASPPSRDEMLLFAISWVKEHRPNGTDFLPAVAAVLEMVEAGIGGRTR